MMGTERNPRSHQSRTRITTPPAGRQKIPLPLLPVLRSAQPPRPEPPTDAARGGVSREEADLLVGDERIEASSGLPPGPGHEGRPEPLQEAAGGRPGVPGVKLLNDLVDEIERDLEIELGRAVAPPALPAYRRTVSCSFSTKEVPQ